jgi:ESS family glutamate:Na+ symporter
VRFWESGAALTALTIVVLLLGCELLARLVPGLRRLGLPLAILAGVVGLVLGEQVLGLVHLDVGLLESVVYHGLALVFIALGLQAPQEGERSKGALSMTFAIVTIMATQAALGLGIVLVLDSTLHPGFGLLLPMGFEEGPGQALSIGTAWETSGLPSGAQVGLIIAVLGYAWSIVGGIPLVLWGRRKGWVAQRHAEGGGGPRTETITVKEAEAGSLDGLTIQIGLIGLCYLLTWAVCALLAGAFAGMPDIAATIWGVHFIVGAGIAVGVRVALTRLVPEGETPVDNYLMRSLGGFGVDFITCAALAAVQLTVLRTHWLPIVLVVTLGGLWTLGLSIWIARRAWTEAPFEHAVLYFGMSTGTLPTGLSLLKMIDPDMRSSAPLSAVFGSIGAIVGGAILILGFFPVIVSAYGGESWPAVGWGLLGGMVGFAIVVVVLWRLVGGLRFRRPLLSAWPKIEE